MLRSAPGKRLPTIAAIAQLVIDLRSLRLSCVRRLQSNKGGVTVLLHLCRVCLDSRVQPTPQETEPPLSNGPTRSRRQTLRHKRESFS